MGPRHIFYPDRMSADPGCVSLCDTQLAVYYAIALQCRPIRILGILGDSGGVEIGSYLPPVSLFTLGLTPASFADRLRAKGNFP